MQRNAKSRLKMDISKLEVDIVQKSKFQWYTNDYKDDCVYKWGK